jgi:hypothetical protein
VKGRADLPACPYGQAGVGREAICLLFFPVLLQMAIIFAGIAVGTKDFVECVNCVGETL